MRRKIAQGGRADGDFHHHAGASGLGWLTALLVCALPAHAQSSPPADERRADIAREPDPAESGARLTELAESLLAQLSSDGADTAILFGIPTEEQVNRAAEVAQEALQAARDAGAALDRAITELSAAPDYADRRELQDLRSRLSVEFRLIRQPAAHARAAAIAASTAKAADRTALQREAIESLAEIEVDDEAARAGRLPLLFSRANPAGASTEAREQLLALVEPAPLARLRNVSPSLARDAVLGAAFALHRAGRSEAGAATVRSILLGRESADALDQIAARDALALLAGDATMRGLTAAGISLLASGEARLDETLAELTLQKLEHALPTDLNPAELPAVGRLALARRLHREGNLDRAIPALESAWADLQRNPSAMTFLAGMALAQALRAHGELLDIARAGQTLLTLTDSETDIARSESLLNSALALLEWAAAHADGVAAEEARRSIETTFRDALRRALDAFPAGPDADRRRFALADRTQGAERRALLQAIRPANFGYARAQLALAWISFAELTSAPSDAQREALALLMLTHIEAADGAPSGPDHPDLSPLIEQARAVALAERRQFDPSVHAALAWDDAGAGEAPDAVEVVRQRTGAALRESLALRDLDRARAVAAPLERISRRQLDRIVRGVVGAATLDSVAIDLTDALTHLNRTAELGELLEPAITKFGVTRGLGAALATGLMGTGDAERAFSIARDIVEASRVLDAHDELYWRAWTIMLDILERQNSDGSRSDAIRAQLARLRLEDPALGGELIRRHLEFIQQRLPGASR